MPLEESTLIVLKTVHSLQFVGRRNPERAELEQWCQTNGIVGGDTKTYLNPVPAIAIQVELSRTGHTINISREFRLLTISGDLERIEIKSRPHYVWLRADGKKVELNGYLKVFVQRFSSTVPKIIADMPGVVIGAGVSDLKTYRIPPDDWPVKQESERHSVQRMYEASIDGRRCCDEPIDRGFLLDRGPREPSKLECYSVTRRGLITLGIIVENSIGTQRGSDRKPQKQRDNTKPKLLAQSKLTIVKGFLDEKPDWKQNGTYTELSAAINKGTRIKVSDTWLCNHRSELGLADRGNPRRAVKGKNEREALSSEPIPGATPLETYIMPDDPDGDVS